MALKVPIPLLFNKFAPVVAAEGQYVWGNGVDIEEFENGYILSVKDDQEVVTLALRCVCVCACACVLCLIVRVSTSLCAKCVWLYSY